MPKRYPVLSSLFPCDFASILDGHFTSTFDPNQLTFNERYSFGLVPLKFGRSRSTTFAHYDRPGRVRTCNLEGRDLLL